jgi:uncharacterized HAD superfamily protein
MEKEKLKIGIDLDDVVFEFVRHVVNKFNEKYKKNISFEDVHTYFFPDVFEIDIHETKMFIKDLITPEFHLSLELCDFAREIILELSKENEIYFITSRVFQEGTRESLEKHFSDFKLHFSSNPWVNTQGDSKSIICKENKIDFMIEDDIKHALDCAGTGISVFLIDKPWNQNFEHENVVRVKDWKEIRDKIAELNNGIY